MANTKKLEDFIANLTQRQKAIISKLVAETATALRVGKITSKINTSQQWQ
ncbi:MAG: hypothetical protein ACK5L5_12785 [Bacteroidales bacterium]